MFEDFIISDSIKILPILPIPITEESQIVTYSVFPVESDFVDMQLTNNGEDIFISFEAIPDSSGYQEFMIKAQDNGGIDNAGIDTALVRFSIMVEAMNASIVLLDTLPN